MLQFLKKSGRKKHHLRSSSTSEQEISDEHKKRQDLVDSCKKSLLSSENYCANNEDLLESRSRLSRNLLEILSDKGCLCYFIQFLENKKALPLVKFWLDVESFKASVQLSSTDLSTIGSCRSRKRSDDQLSQNTDFHFMSGNKRMLDKSLSLDGCDSMSYLSADDDSISTTSLSGSFINSERNFCDGNEENRSTKSDLGCSGKFLNKPECDINTDQIINSANNLIIVDERLSKINDFISNEDVSDDCFMTNYSNLCDISMRQPLTDDEKSQICEKNSKKGSSFHNATGNLAIAHNKENNFNSMEIETIQEEDDDNKKESEIEIHDNMKETKRLSELRSSIATDAIRIYRKYLTTNSIHWIDIPATIQSQISLALCCTSNEGELKDTYESTISPYCFDDAQKHIFDRLEAEFLNEFLESSFYCKYCVDVLTSDSLQISDILYNESALFYFMEFLEQENKRDYLDFWISATNFKKHLEQNNSKYDFAEVQSDVMVLYEKYFSLQAKSPLHMSDNVRFQIEENICSVNGPMSTCFDLPVRIVEHYLNKNYFKVFIKSQLFYKYLSELFNKIQEHKIPVNTQGITFRAKTRHRKTHSDCSNDNTKQIRNKYISTQNTLLAMETPIKSKAVRSASTSDMQIDSRQIDNPDLLWRRNSLTGGLSFGRVNSLGRYERDFDMDVFDDKWSLASGGNKLKKAVRKLVNLPEDKVQEEIAWQVAEMIVKDITNVTLNNDTNT